MAESDKEDVRETELQDGRNPSSAPLIFISHDNRDADLAESFSKLLSSVSAGVLKSFRSSDRTGSQGIEYGVEWYPELMSKLESASDVVCLLTQRSLDRPWILYEAGVAKGKLNTPVYGIALGIPLSRANSGPFAQFQNCDDNEESLTKLVMQLVRRIPGSEPDHDAIQMQVRTFKERATTTLESLADPQAVEEKESAVGDASVAKLFEEVKVMFQDLPTRIESRLVERPLKPRRLRRFSPMLFELSEVVSSKEGDPVGLLVIASLFRDEAPWLYEMAIEAYRCAKAGDTKGADLLVRKLVEAAEFTVHSPLGDDLGWSKDMHMMIREMPMFMDHLMRRNRTDAE